MEVGMIGHPGDLAVKRVEVAIVIEQDSAIVRLMGNSAMGVTVRETHATPNYVLVRI